MPFLTQLSMSPDSRALLSADSNTTVELPLVLLAMLYEQHGVQMLRASRIEKGMFDADNKLVGLSVESPDERRLAHEVNQSIAHPTPELFR
jgi:hypothetical protein